MSEFSKKRNTLNKAMMIFIGAAVLVRLVLYVYIIIKGIGSFGVGDYMSLIINLIMYTSILKYTYDYFVKGKDVSLGGLIFKFGIARLATLLGLKTDNQTIFMVSAILVFLVPYLSANIKTPKINIVLLLVILVLSIILSCLYVTSPVQNQVATLGTFIYNLDSINPAVEWVLFTILFFVRGLVVQGKFDN